MKNLLFRVMLGAMALSAVSCGLLPKNYSPDAAGMEALGKDLQAKFGADAWYTDVNVSYSDGKAILGVTETDDPASLQMRQWVCSEYTGWRQTSDITLEISGDASPEAFMFQLGREVKMELVGSLVDKSKAQLTAEKKIANPRLESVFLHTPDHEDKSAMKIRISLEPENGGTEFDFVYNLAGELEDFDY